MDRKDSIVQTLEMPLKESKEGVIAAYLELRLKGAQIIGSIESSSDTDNRINLLVEWMIGGIPNANTRTTLREKRDKRITEETKGLTTNEERGRKIRQINMEISGDVSDYMDRYIGGERTNRVSFIIPIKEMREVMKKVNPEHFREHMDEQGVVK
jgi:hypothetical protein